MKKRIKIYLSQLVLFFVIALINYSCNSNLVKGGDEEGIIEFDTKGIDEKHPLYGLAPSEAILKFKKDKFLIEMSTMGFFNTSIIGDLKLKTITQTVKFMDIKQACIQDEKSILEDFKDYELKIDETKETKKIAGFKCYKLKCTYVSQPNTAFDAWYTKELGLAESNDLSPYKGIKGVLMDYRVKKFGLEMHFLARKYKHQEVKDSEFEVPAYMKIVSKEEMQKLFDNFQK
ncbi:MAG: hypothetical protein JSU07_05930 [Bacteroidetes bacterium]|nr:hypothetical protein [Bacteroidota bacterium]